MFCLPPAIVAKPVSVLTAAEAGRSRREWGELEIAWHQQRLALVCGEPGIGKTRLLGDFVARHDGAIVVGARPGDERVPFALLARLLRAVTQRHTPILEDWARAELSRLLPELGAAPETKLQLVRLQRAVVHALLVASNAGLTGCAIDDLHFADDASVESLLALIAGKEADMRWLVGVRAAEISRRLLEWLERTEPNEVARIELGPLDVQAIEALLISLVLPDFDARAWAEPLARHTGGNPLFILETLSAALTQDATALRGGVALLPAPSSVGQLIERRLHKLSRDALRLARVAALAGQDFSVGLAACVLSAHPLDLAEAWHELEVAQIIRADRDGSAFAHDLILETTLRTVPHAIARVMHKDIAEFLETHGAQPARIAGHYYEAEQWSKAGAHYRIAADRARSIAFGANAAELYQRAADSLEKAGQRTERLEALNWHGICLHFMKRFPEYAAVAQKMSSLAVTPREQLWTLIALAKSRFEITHDDESIRLMRAARLLARELGDTPSDCSLAEWEALALSFLGRQQEALEVGKTLRAFIEANPQDTEMAMRRRQYAYLLEMDNQFEQAIDFADSAIVRARADGNLGLVSETLVIRGACLYNLGQLDAAIDEYHAARRLQIEGAGGTMAWTTYDIMLGRYLQEAARYREAHQVLANVLEGHASADDWVSAQCAATLAHCFITLGQTARARRLLGSAPPADSVARIGWLHAKVRLARAENKPTRALIDEMAELAVVSPRAERLTWQVQIELARELDAAEAVALAQQVVDESRAKRTYSAYLPAKAMLVDGLRRAGRHDESTRTARGLTDELATRAAIGLYPAEYWWLIFQAFSAAGDHVDATTSLASAVDWINDVALPNIPDEYSDSFLNRNPVNRAILTTASRRR